MAAPVRNRPLRRYTVVINEAALQRCCPDIDLWADHDATWAALVGGLLERSRHGAGIPIVWFVGQFELGEAGAFDAGNKHAQCYLVLGKSVRFTAVKRLLPGAHLDVSAGDDDANFAYCTKESTRIAGPYAHGKRPAGQGSRSDIADAVAAIGGGANLRAYVLVHPGIIRYWSSFARFQAAGFKHRAAADPPCIYWCWGETGTGKTLWAANKAGDDVHWLAPATQRQWWDGYRQQGTLVIDEYRPTGGGLSFFYLLRLFDCRPILTEIKGAFIPFNSHTIILTTPLSPQDTFADHTVGDINQLLRRITHIKHFTLP